MLVQSRDFRAFRATPTQIGQPQDSFFVRVPPASMAFTVLACSSAFTKD
jgi:hypothetical protein